MAKHFVTNVKDRFPKGKISTKNRPLKLVAVGLCILISVLLVKNIFKLFSVEDRIEGIKDKIVLEEKEREDLLRRNDEINTPGFIEEEARDKLGFVKEGEVVVVLPPDDYLRSLVPRLEEESSVDLPNWIKWWKLFSEE